MAGSKTRVCCCWLQEYTVFRLKIILQIACLTSLNHFVSKNNSESCLASTLAGDRIDLVIAVADDETLGVQHDASALA
jgi:hypothetical protein